MAYVPPHRRRELQEQSYSSTDGDDVMNNKIDSVYCINLDERPDKWKAFIKKVEETRHVAFLAKLQRFSAINGAKVNNSEKDVGNSVCLEWDATQNAYYSPKIIPGFRTMTAGELGCALSHITLWRRLATSPRCDTMLVLEDDAVLVKNKGKSQFISALNAVWKQLPKDHFGLLYLGFSSRGERDYVNSPVDLVTTFQSNVVIQLYKPTYGYHTHAYVVTKEAARVLIDKLPVRGPVDVWLADNNWFDLRVFCAVIAGRGWRNEDGTFEGGQLVSQDRRNTLQSDIVQSSSIQE